MVSFFCVAQTSKSSDDKRLRKQIRNMWQMAVKRLKIDSKRKETDTQANCSSSSSAQQRKNASQPESSEAQPRNSVSENSTALQRNSVSECSAMPERSSSSNALTRTLVGLNKLCICISIARLVKHYHDFV